MSFNGSGTFNINTAGQPVVTGTVITSSAFNALTADLATGLSTCITKDGQTTVTANIPMNSFKFTGLAAGTAATDSVRLSQLQAGGATLVTVTGTNTYAGTMSPALAAYAAGNTFTFLVPNTNTTSCTLNIDGLGAKAITRDGTTALVAGDLVANSEVAVVYDGTQFQVLNSNSKTNFNLSGTLTVAGNTTLSSGTANSVSYLNGSKVLSGSSNLTFDGTTLTANALTTTSTVTINGGTANGVAYLNGSKVLTTGSALTFDGTSLTVTAGKSVVQGAASGFKVNRRDTSANAWEMYSTAGNFHWYSYSAASDLMLLDSSGNLGIGTTSPSVRLDVQGGSINTSSFVTITPTTGTSNAIYRATNTGGTFYAGLDNSAGGVTGTAYSGLLWHTGAYPIAFGTSGTERMRIDSSGNLGLGVTPSAWYTPDYKAFQLTGGGALYNNGANNFVALSQNMFVNGSLANTYIATAAASRYRQSAGTHIWDIAPSGTAGNAITFTQAMTLNANGSLNVGNTSFGKALRAGFRGDSTSVSTVEIQNESATGTMLVFCTNGEATVGSVSFTSAGVAYNTTSDRRLKTNIKDADSASSLIDAIQVRQFDWLSDDSHQRYGMIAQELYEVAPEAVHKPVDDADMMAVDYSKLVPMLVKEIQELRARVLQLENK